MGDIPMFGAKMSEVKMTPLDPFLSCIHASGAARSHMRGGMADETIIRDECL